ncbi:MAG: TetR/AcrR family transcriptional regulator [Solirubrobacterales bacterium]|nr:TetR/AcrR family transcriptional regulator [Solirubrobacterales bacterium]
MSDIEPPAAVAAPDGNRPDGRTLRSQRTRRSIVEALRALVIEGDLRPTTEAVAQRAGVSERSIFQHFVDREALLLALGEYQLAHIATMVRSISADASLAHRLDEVAAQQAKIWEEVTPVRRAAILTEPFSPAIHRALAFFRSTTHDEIGRIFANELLALQIGDRQIVHEGMTAVAEWPFWESLRAHQGVSIVDATTTLRHSLAAIISAPSAVGKGSL